VNTPHLQTQTASSLHACSAGRHGRLSDLVPLNHRVLVTDSAHLQPKGINPHERADDAVNLDAAMAEHTACVAAFCDPSITQHQIYRLADLLQRTLLSDFEGSLDPVESRLGVRSE
jgi:hypothetical protein